MLRTAIRSERKLKLSDLMMPELLYFSNKESEFAVTIKTAYKALLTYGVTVKNLRIPGSILDTTERAKLVHTHRYQLETSH